MIKTKTIANGKCFGSPAWEQDSLVIIDVQIFSQESGLNLIADSILILNSNNSYFLRINTFSSPLPSFVPSRLWILKYSRAKMICDYIDSVYFHCLCYGAFNCQFNIKFE